MTDSLFSLTDQVAFVTGAGNGIGQRLALGFAEAGADVACFDIDGSAAEGTAARITQETGRRAIGVGGDATDAEAVDAALTRTTDELGGISVSLNCAGIANAAPAEDMDAETFRRVVDVNLTGVFLCAQAAARRMLPRGGGSIINIASMSATIANRGLRQVHYNSSKAGVVQLTKSMATEWADSGIRVNAISPGYILTPMNKRPEVADRLKGYAADTPMQRIGTVDDLVGPAVFLASAASGFCTGIDLLVDGGYVCW